MITRQNSTKYSQLFEKASKELDLPKPISSLNEYFAALHLLVQRPDGLKYTILPLDEEPFPINANTRKIDVPAEFKYGVGVQGDQLAETIYFKIDRYFDAVDLNTQNIFIEWEDAQGVPGFSREYVRDIESEPNYLIFGWALAKDITQHPGKVRFSIRFYTFDERSEENKLIYSFSTQPCEIIINQTLDFDVENANQFNVLDEEVIDIIKQRFEQCRTEEDNVEEPVDPPIVFTNQFTIKGGDDCDINDPSDYDDDNTQYTLRMQAVGNGIVDFFAERMNTSGNFVAWDTVVKEDYIQTLDESRVPNKVYYIEVNKDGVKAHDIFREENFTKDTNTGILEKYYYAVVTQPGSYRMKAQNRIGLSTATVESPTMTFPASEAPVLHTELLPMFFDEDGNVKLSVHYLETEPKGIKTYSWAKRIPNTDEYSIIEGALAKDYEAHSEAEQEYYRVTVTNTRNNDPTPPSVSSYYRVTKEPQAPIFTAPTSAITLKRLGDTLVADIDASIPADSVSIAWYYTRDMEPEGGFDDGEICSPQILTELTEDGRYRRASFIPLTEGSVGHIGDTTYIGKGTGVYYAVATLTRNTHTATSGKSNVWSVS